MTDALFRVALPTGPRLARGTVDSGPQELLRAGLGLDDLLAPVGSGLASAFELHSSERCPARGALASADRRPGDVVLRRHRRALARGASRIEAERLRRQRCRESSGRESADLRPDGSDQVQSASWADVVGVASARTGRAGLVGRAV